MGFSQVMPWRAYLILWHGGLLPLHAGLILGLAACEDPVSRFLSRRPFEVLGDSSYALYIVQVFAGWICENFAQWWSEHIPEGILQSALFPLVLAGCTMIGRYVIQIPAERFLKRRL